MSDDRSPDLADEERVALVERGELPGAMATAEELGNVPADEPEVKQTAVTWGENEVLFELYDLEPSDMVQFEAELRALLAKWDASQIHVNGNDWD